MSEAFKKFDDAMTKLLKAKPQIVKAAMEQEKEEREEERKTKRDSAFRASSSRDA